MRRWVVIAVVCSAGCSTDVHITFPNEPLAKTAIVASESAAYVVDLTGAQSPLLLEVEAGSRVGLVYYETTPIALGVTEGRIDELRDGRALPKESIARYEARVEADGTSWSAVDVVSPVLERVRLPPFDVDACAVVGACWRGGLPICRTPCETPTVEPPLPPLIVCPTGWTETAAAIGPRFCTPPHAEDGSCAPTQRETYDGLCLDIGRGCDIDGWPVDVEAEGRSVLYVDAQAGSGGSGSRARPFGRLDDAVSAALTNTTIALGAGQFRAVAIRTDDVWIRGCGATTTIASTSATVAAATLFARGARLADLTFDGTNTGVETLRESSNTELEGVIVTGGSRGIMARAGLVVRDARVAGGDDGIVGDGDVDIADVFIVGAEHGINCVSGTATVTRTVIEDVGDSAVYAQSGCAMTASEVRVERAGVLAFAAVDANSSLHVRDAIARNLGDPATTGSAHGLFVFGAELTAERVYIQDARGAAVVVASAGQLTSTDVFVQGVRIIDRNISIGMLIDDGTADVRRFATDGLSRRGIDVGEHGVLHLEDAYAFGEGTPNAGLAVQAGGVVSVRRLVVEGPFLIGVTIDDGAILEVFQSIEVIDPRQVGVTIAPATATSASRIRVRGGREVGFKARTFLNDADELIVSHVDVTCTEPLAIGIQGLFASALSISDFQVRGCGVGLDLGTPLFGAFRRGVLKDNRDGLIVEEENDLLSATHDISFEENDRRFRIRVQ